MASDKSFVDPSSLSLPSPRSDAGEDSPKRSAESLPGPSRKRARTDMSAEERKEARAHRNRIAAQNSRDKRKAQFSALERRVAELEEENRQLRAGMSGAELQRADEKRRDEVEREKAREKENAELKERIRSLEKGWEAVMKVLAAQGLPANVVPSPAPAPSSSTSTSLPTPTLSAKSPSSTSTPPTTPPTNQNTTTSFPVLVPSSPVFPLTPSPSLSSASIFSDETETTRHLARVANDAAIPPAKSLQRVVSPSLVDLLLRSRLHRLPPNNLPHTASLRWLNQTPGKARTNRMLPWKRGFARFLRAHPQCRRRFFLLLAPRNSAQPPSKSPPSSQSNNQRSRSNLRRRRH